MNSRKLTLTVYLSWLVEIMVTANGYCFHELKREQLTSWLYFRMLYCTGA